MSVVVTAAFTPKPGRERDLVDALRRSIPAIHEEAGCALFSLHVTEAGAPFLIEKWDSVDLLEAHLAGQPVAALVENIAPLLDGDAVVTRLETVPAGRKDKGQL